MRWFARLVGGLVLLSLLGGGAWARVIGDDPDSHMKKALILSPFRWEFGQYDDGAMVKQILEATRGYSQSPGEVDYRENAQESDRDVTVDDYRNWDNFDLIHVTSHAEHYDVTDPGTNQQVQFTGLKTSEIDDDFDQYRGDPRGGLARIGGEVVVMPSFFDPLTNALVVVNACETGMQNDLATALTGTGTAVTGWGISVSWPTARNSLKRVYEMMAYDGLPLSAAKQDIHARARNFRYTGANRFTTAGDDVRLREVIVLLDPKTGQELGEEGVLEIQGKLDDGEEDDVVLKLKLDGVQSGQTQDFKVRIEIDGQQRGPEMSLSHQLAGGTATQRTATRTTPTGSHNFTWYELKRDIDLGFDATEGTWHKLKAIVTLPEGGESKHTIQKVRFTGDSEGSAMLEAVGGPDPMLAQAQELPDMSGVDAQSGDRMVEMLEGADIELPEGVSREEAMAALQQMGNLVGGMSLPLGGSAPPLLDPSMVGVKDVDSLPPSPPGQPFNGPRTLTSSAQASYRVMPGALPATTSGRADGTAVLDRSDDGQEVTFDVGMEVGGQITRWRPPDGPGFYFGGLGETRFEWTQQWTTEITGPAAYDVALELATRGGDAIETGEVNLTGSIVCGWMHIDEGEVPTMGGEFHVNLSEPGGDSQGKLIRIEGPPEGQTRTVWIFVSMAGKLNVSALPPPFYVPEIPGVAVPTGWQTTQGRVKGRAVVAPDTDEQPPSANPPAIDDEGPGPVAALPAPLRRAASWLAIPHPAAS